MNLTTRLGSLRLRNPTILASGILCNGPLLKRAAVEGGAGAVVTKTVTRELREGYPTPVLAGVDGGLINAVGLANSGYKKFMAEELPIAKQGKVPVILSAGGGTAEEFRDICALAAKAGADAVELNLSCPHVEKHGLQLGSDPEVVGRIVKEIKRVVAIPVFAKLGLSDNLIASAVAAQDAGADAIVAINTIRAMAIDVDARVPVLANVYGGLSGPAIHPVALRCVHELSKKLTVPIVGCGGVQDWRTAVDFLIAGASAVQVGSALATGGIGVFREIERGIKSYMKVNDFKNLKEIIGCMDV